MREFYNKEYYTIDQIPKYRLDFINLKLKWFIELLGLKNSDWPLDCVKLLEKIKALQPFNFNYGLVPELRDNLDALCRYLPKQDLYMIQINMSKVNYPYQFSHQRRLNFTLPHELGHIVLGHLLIPRELKTEQKIALEDMEADEFAGRFVMPKSLLFSVNFHSIDSVAEHFIVSKTALWKRLNNIKRLDLLHSRTVRSCSCCGNTNFSMFSEYCGICGTPISNGLNGIRRINYPSKIEVDRFKRVKVCPACQSHRFNGEKCSICGTYIFNLCSDYIIDSINGCSHANPSNSRFCEMCGKPTHYFKRGILSSWDTALDEEQVNY